MSKALQEIAKAMAYNPATGELIWARDVSARVRAGMAAGTVCKGGYRVVGLNRRYVKAHRLAFFIINGREPVGVIDHINGDKLDNRIENLRECSHSENGQNSRKQKNNSSGYAGVHWHKRRQLWVASIRHQRKGIHLGYFAEKEDAYAAYLAEKARLHVAAPKGCGLEASRPFDPARRRRKSKALLNPSKQEVEA